MSRNRRKRRKGKKKLDGIFDTVVGDVEVVGSISTGTKIFLATLVGGGIVLWKAY